MIPLNMLRGSKSSTRVSVFLILRVDLSSFSLGPCTSLRTAKNEVDTTLLNVSDDMGAQPKHFLSDPDHHLQPPSIGFPWVWG